MLFDLDTVCWAPFVRDVTYLIKRAGNAENSGFTAAEIIGRFEVSPTEVEAAMELRLTASLIVQAHHRFNGGQVLLPQTA
ncbi:hypothetical protein [Arthrobacter sp. HLT1-21]